ncbi:TetR/AcrR family transcriptional regulator [Vibrio ulleungensis]|uniref:TetR/AcrR family transcriptional regulator n=1 Tax=Vibrio ulleungensis TaxID=2807619 RepID=A0ABS2HDS2_9VIBR|nr:TetR/AcrR family transcriptional regulator [Vibrio ulleungensis]MBM7035733.1 TetR/AcrR family transcriptional regulator [Vibrio ulleungensis]
MSDKTIRVGRQTAEDAHKTKTDILNGAFELFSTKGFDSTSIRQIGNHAGVSHSTIQHHFGSKLDIWFAIVDRYNAAYITDLNQALEHTTNCDQDSLILFKNAVLVLIKTLFDHPKMLRIICMEYDPDSERAQYLTKSMVPTHQHISTLFTAAKKESKRLEIYNEETFLIALLGLISSPILLTILDNLLPETELNSADFQAKYQRLIMNVLFGEP